MTRWLALIGVLFASLFSFSALAAGGFEVGFSDQDTRFNTYSAAPYSGVNNANQTEAGVVYTHLQLTFDRDSDSALFDAALNIERFIDAENRLSIGLGLNPYYANYAGPRNDNDDALNLAGIGMGINATYSLMFPQSNLSLRMRGYIYHSPSVLSFGDADNATTQGLRVALPILGTSEIFGEYTEVRADANKGDNKELILADGVFIGIRLGL